MRSKQPPDQSRSVASVRRGRRQKASRETILEAAAQAFVEAGYRNTSLDDIAARLNVAKPTIYYNAGDKEVLLSECFRIALDAYSGAVEDDVAVAGSARDRLHGVVRRYVSITATVYGRCLHRVPDLELTEPVRNRLRAVKRQVDARIRDLLAKGVEDGSLRVTDIRSSTFALSGAMNSIAQWYSPTGRLTPDEIAEHLWEIFMEGLKPR
jgi:AcrR family transcriptional regulator